MCEVMVCDTSVKVKQGDITAESTNAIVNLNNATLDQQFGVSKAILSAAGDTVKKECACLGKLPNDGFVVTSAGNLKCQKIIHLINVIQTVIVEAVKKALTACDRDDMRTISLPAIGTGAANLDPKISINLVMKGIEEYLADPTTMTILSEINVVVFDPDVYEEYLIFFSELSGVSGAILAAGGDTVKEECKDIGILPTDGIAITSGGNNKCKKILHIIGPTRVSEYELSMERILLECHKNGITSVALPAIGTGMAHVNPEKSIKAILSSILSCFSETLLPTLETISIIVLQEDMYQTYLKVFQAKCAEIQATQQEEKILSAVQVKIDYPKSWTGIVESEFQEVTLEKDSQEYKDVKNKFIKSASPSPLKVVKIKRIQNRKLWESFTINKQAVDRKNPGQRNIQHLYHGTTSEVTEGINRGGFNRIYHGRNGTACGTGTYFAVGSNYSCGDKYSVPDSKDGVKYVYQAVVITGRYCMGNSAYKEPPYIKDDPSGDRYDAVVNNIKKPTYFVVFHDDYAYPEYLITFKLRTP